MRTYTQLRKTIIDATIDTKDCPGTSLWRSWSLKYCWLSIWRGGWWCVDDGNSCASRHWYIGIIVYRHGMSMFRSLYQSITLIYAPFTSDVKLLLPKPPRQHQTARCQQANHIEKRRHRPVRRSAPTSLSAFLEHTRST